VPSSRSPWPRRLGRLLLWSFLALAVVYAVGGAQGFRRARRWMRAFLEPPTPAEMARARRADSAAQAQAAAAPPLPTGAAAVGGEPTPVGTIVLVIGGVLAGALVLALVTGRRSTGRQ